MSRSAAKLLTLAGILCSALFAVHAFFNLFQSIAVSPSAILFFAGGIVLVVISLAYYTEK